MPPRALVPTAIVTAPTPERRNFVHSSPMHDNPNHSHQAGPSRSYGSVSTRTSPGSQKGKEPAMDCGLDRCEVESCDSDDEDMEPLVDSMAFSKE
jgi:hypothetical protein